MFKEISITTGLKWLFFGVIVLLSACTQDFGGAEGRSGGVNENGQAIYAEQCASCHGSSGEGGSGGSLVGCATCGDTSSLISKIERDMPSASNPLSGDDAIDTASYIFDAFNAGSISSVQRTLPGVVTMTDSEAIYKIAFELAGRLPTDAEVNLFSESAAGEKEVVYGFMEEDYFYEHLKDMFNDSMLTDKYRSENDNNVNSLYENTFDDKGYEVFPDLDAWKADVGGQISTSYLDFFAKEAIARKPMLFVEYLARNNRDFREFVNGKYTVVNKFSFDSFGGNVVIVDPDSPQANGSSALVTNPQWKEFSSLNEAQSYLDVVEYLGNISTNGDQYIMSDYPYDPRDIKAAQLYYLDESDSEDYGPLSSEGVPHSGVITDEIFLNIYTATETNMHRNRARMVYWFFAAKDLLAIEGNRDASALEFEDFGGVNVGESDPTQTNEDCTVCHDIMDPVAKAFESYSLNGLYDTDNLDEVPTHRKNVGWGLSNAAIEYNSTSGTNYAYRELQWLGEHIANDPAYARGISQIVVRGLTGQTIIGEPGDDSPDDYRNAYVTQSRLIANAASEFKSSGYNIKALIYAVTKSAYFRSTGLSSEVYSDEYGQIGSIRYLPPQMLQQKLIAINSGGWVDNSTVNLQRLSARMFLGGKDSDEVLKDADSVGGIISAALERMAVKEACDIVDNEFDLDRTERSLFKYVELSTDMADAATRDSEVRAIRSNIQFLYLAMLHKEVDLGSEEIDIIFELFSNTLEAHDSATNRSGCTDSRSNSVKDAWYVVLVFMLTDYRFIYS